MKRNIIKLSVIVLILTAGFLAFYLYAIPKISTDIKILEWIEKTVAKNMNAELVINNPYIKTSIKPEITFSIDYLSLKKDDEILLNLKNFDTKINFYKILKRKITLEKLGVDEIYANINELQKLKVKDDKKKKGKSFLSFDCFNTLFYIKKLNIVYISPKNVKIKLHANDLQISDSREPKMLHFDIFLDLLHNNEHLTLFLKDGDKVYFKDRKLHVDNLEFKVNNSLVYINFLLDEKNHYSLNLKSDKFEINNVKQFLNTDLLMPNSHEFVACFKDFIGDFNFNININEKDLNGYLKVNKIGAKLIPVADIPLTVTKGIINIDSKDIEIKDFEGYYGSAIKNIIKLSGLIKDYPKTAQTNLDIEGIAYEEFAKYLSKTAGIKINIINNAFSEFKLTFANGTKIDIKGKVKVPQNSDVLFEGSSISPSKYLREFDIDMDLFKEFLTINNIDYHIVDKINSNEQKPLITVHTKVNITNGFVYNLGFNIPEPLPSEFFNILVGQRIFRRGTFSGKLDFINDENPHLEGEMNLKDTFIVGQGIIVKNMVAKTYNNLIKITSDGYIRRAKYNFNTTLLNKMVFPIIVTDTDLNFDVIDVEKIIQTFAPRPQTPQNRPATANRPKLAQSNISSDYFEVNEKTTATEGTNETVAVAFQPNLIEIKKGIINIQKGSYKKMNFGNLKANITLTRQGVLELQSNKFDLTDGISTLKVYCDLAKQKYFIRLGAKDVDTDAIATSILNLDKEITGHANALIELNTDESLKLNGKIKFAVTDGSIAKLGLVQYILNMASVFRNPLAMVSPSSFYDIVNIPEGNFKKINGTIIMQDNSIKGMMIQSSSPQLSSFIVGRINLENMDASLRIYTKFNEEKKGVFGFLRELSLNSLAMRASSYTKGENESYYAAEIEMLPKLETGEETAKIFLTKFDGDLQSANFISSLKKIK